MISLLFVDDEPAVLNALQRVFRTVKLPAYYASNAEAGLTLLKQHPIGAFHQHKGCTRCPAAPSSVLTSSLFHE